ncbi:hypothetical protein A4S06_11170 [Erysipelotrichaceae bacterium MTC7]|nr:hypothetical protein A4S06_11170 [Erysipelotrichaceae bacterium MTC7]
MYQFKQVEPSAHDAFVSKHPLCNLLQSSSWAKVKENWDHAIVGVEDHGTLVASALVLIKRLPGGLTMFYIPRGPIMDYENARLVKYFIQELKKFAKTYKCVFIKMDPGIHVNDFTLEQVNEDRYDVTTIMENLREAGAFHQGYPKTIESVIQPRYQANVYACDDFEEKLPKHTKRLIKDAIKHDVVVRKAGIDEVDKFSDVVALTEQRKQVSLRNYDYFKKLMDIYKDDAFLYVATVDIAASVAKLTAELESINKELETTDPSSRKKLTRLHDRKNSLEKSLKEYATFETTNKEQVIAGVLSIKYGNTMEMLYAGMDDRFKKFMPQYYIYPEQMKEAFSLGCAWCNMGGVEGDFNDGLTKFKSNFNPTINEFIGEFNIPVNKLLYKPALWAYNARK